MLRIKDHHIADEIIKLIKKYFNDFDKIVQRLQLVVLQRREKIDRDIKTIIVYILNDFRRVYSDKLTILSVFNRKKL